MDEEDNTDTTGEIETLDLDFDSTEQDLNTIEKLLERSLDEIR